jgi:hypothetical protein
MSNSVQNGTLSARFDHLLKRIGSQRFLRKEGLGNEVPFFICPFKATEATAMEKLEKQLANRLSQQGVRVMLVNLYDLVHDIMAQEGDWEWYITNESSKDKDDLLESLQGILDTETVIVPEIARRMSAAEFDVLFINGVGEVFPYIRSHNVLNNLQKVAKDQPTVMFFPGEYTHSLEKGASLDLFGRLHDDKYYRAFNIYDCAT